LAGFEPDVDVPIVFTGVRPGEKIFEEIFSEEEKRVGTTQWDKIFITKTEKPINDKIIKKTLKDLASALKKKESSFAKKVLDQFISSSSKKSK